MDQPAPAGADVAVRPVAAVYPHGVLYCEGATRTPHGRVSTCEGGTGSHGRRARWITDDGHLLCGTCKRLATLGQHPA